MKIELKPCPFCGNPSPRVVMDTRKHEIYVVCDGMHGCGASSGVISYSLDNALAEATQDFRKECRKTVSGWWNRRVQDD